MQNWTLVFSWHPSSTKMPPSIECFCCLYSIAECYHDAIRIFITSFPSNMTMSTFPCYHFSPLSIDHVGQGHHLAKKPSTFVLLPATHSFYTPFCNLSIHITACFPISFHPSPKACDKTNLSFFSITLAVSSSRLSTML